MAMPSCAVVRALVFWETFSLAVLPTPISHFLEIFVKLLLISGAHVAAIHGIFGAITVPI